jgi:hypothetical protein
MRKDYRFAYETIETWDKFLKRIKELSKKEDEWLYRGHGEDYKLATSLERAQEYFGIDGSDLPGIEEQIIRYYRRGFPEEREDELNKDKLYCISLMQDHGAPTRLLDFTWSPYIGAFFALENSKIPSYKSKKYTPVLWCIKMDWIESIVETIVDKNLVESRRDDKTRNDDTFVPMYMSESPTKFVHFENPLRLNRRLVIQQGIFLCPGDVSSSFEDNLKNLKGWNDKNNVLKMYFNFSERGRKSALQALHRMNINQASLFPGLDGYSRSMKQRIPFFERMSKKKAGKGGT